MGPRRWVATWEIIGGGSADVGVGGEPTGVGNAGGANLSENRSKLI